MKDQAHRSPAQGETRAQQFENARSQAGQVSLSGESGVLFEQAMAQTRMAITLADPNREDAPLVFVNRAFRELTGYSEEEIIGRNCRFLQGPGTDPAQVRKLREAIASEEVVIVELLNYRKDGTPFWNALHLGPIYNDDGSLRYIFGSQWDVTDVHAARADEKHARMMEREISHRMKNMFAVISSIVTMTGKLDGAEGLAEKINARIRSLGRAHEAMLEVSFTEGPTDPRKLFRDLLHPYAPMGAGSVTLVGGKVPLDSNVVSVLALSLHELAINAVKHGAFSVPDGHVRLDWSLEEGPDGEARLGLGWTETGGPAPGNGAARKGIGMTIISRMLALGEGDIQYDWRPEGLHVEIHFPTSL
ncbi:PAS domain-containing protein [Limimaricola hongkongensis]|uniref:histidine kinase n=1 Tax=Limimaricola hongkongensis DSM 17492 TaxID=1122180 RepID=A0A017HH61_9RHOB|nr:PAS domain-containing protein [Limimaricola hongkongensis]EYD73114.1 sensory box histidine kinase [Limimaricola hongkongensis DSM 17492]